MFAIVGAVVIALGVSLFVPVASPGTGGTSPLPSGVAATGNNGLQLQLSLNATQITSGQSIGIGVSVLNTLPTTNNVSASTLTPFDCPPRFLPEPELPLRRSGLPGSLLCGERLPGYAAADIP